MTDGSARARPPLARAAAAAAVAATSLTAGLLLFAFVHGPVRGSVGDVLVVVFLDAALAAGCLAAGVDGRRAGWARLAGVGALSVGLELLQGLHLVGKDAPWVLHLVLGATFDPWDLLWYAIGLWFAAGFEVSWTRRVSSPAPG